MKKVLVRCISPGEATTWHLWFDFLPRKDECFIEGGRRYRVVIVSHDAATGQATVEVSIERSWLVFQPTPSTSVQLSLKRK